MAKSKTAKATDWLSGNSSFFGFFSIITKPVWFMLFVFTVFLVADYFVTISRYAFIGWGLIFSLMISSVIQGLSLIVSVSLCLCFAPWCWHYNVDHKIKNQDFEVINYIISVGLILGLVILLTQSHFLFITEINHFVFLMGLLAFLVALAIYVPRLRNTLFAVLLLVISANMTFKVLVPDMWGLIEITVFMLLMSAVCLKFYMKKADLDIAMLLTLLAVFALAIPGISEGVIFLQ